MTIFFAGKGTQFANEYKEKGHRLFSYKLIEGILENKVQIHVFSNFVQKNVRDISLLKGKTYIQKPYVEGFVKGKL